MVYIVLIFSKQHHYLQVCICIQSCTYTCIVFQITKQDNFAEVVRDIAEYTMRDLLNPVSFLKTINLHIDRQLKQGILV